MPPELEPWTVCILFRPPDAPDLPEEELDRLQEEHIAHLQRLRDEGFLAAGGPLTDDRPDESWRGFSIYRTGVEETRALTARDPLVLAGRLAPTIMTWLVPVGELPLRSQSAGSPPTA